MSPTVLRAGGFRFFFFSREESRPHVHVHHAAGEAKIWLEPVVEVALNCRLTPERLNAAVRLVQEHHDELRVAWHAHFVH